jgi:predicted CoA-binding protein
MITVQERVKDFLAQKRIAVAGVSRRGDTAANVVYIKLRKAGYTVFAVNPNASEVEGDPCYPDLRSIPGGVGAVVVATHPRVSDQIVRECAEIGISRLWLHCAIGRGSASKTALSLCSEKGISVVPGGCPVMFCEPVDFGHRCLRWVLSVTGGRPLGKSQGNR